MISDDLLCYYPTNVVVVDDSSSFLAMLNKQLPAMLPRQLYKDPTDALINIKNSEKHNAYKNRVLRTLSTDDFDGLLFHDESNSLMRIDFSNIYEEVYNKNRFNRISVLLVDYNMGNMNGIEFCKNITDKSIMKIMITEMSAYEAAVSAFNEGIIDKFILKNTPDFFEKINESIEKAQAEYFKNIYGLDGILGFVFRDQLKFFESSAYNYVMPKIYEFITPVEYYLFNRSGSILFLDDKGCAVWLVIKSKQELDELYDIASCNGAAKDVLLALRNKQKMPILLSERDYKEPAEKWTMSQIESFNSNDAYYSIVTNYKTDAINFSKVVSFLEYRNNNSNRFKKGNHFL